MLNFKEVYDFLILNNYLEEGEDGEPKLSSSFEDEMIKMKAALIVAAPLQVTVAKKTISPAVWQELYINFIRQAEVPPRIKGSNGNMYEANKYSEPGLKGFKKALLEGANYDLLVKSTMLYYKSSIDFKNIIGNYMGKGLWKSDYLALRQSAREGTVDEHVKEKTESNEFSKYERG